MFPLVSVLSAALLVSSLAGDGASCAGAHCSWASNTLLQQRSGIAMRTIKPISPLEELVPIEETTGTGTHCSFQRLVTEIDVGLDNESATEADFCEEADGTTHLLDPKAVEDQLSGASVGDQLILDLSATSLLGVQEHVVHDITKVYKHQRRKLAMGVLECENAASTGYRAPYDLCSQQITPYCNSYQTIRDACPLICNSCPDMNFEYDGVRAVRMLALIVELEDMAVGYLGRNRRARERFALSEFGVIANTLSKSTYDKLTVDVDASRAVTIPLAINGLQSNDSPLTYTDTHCKSSAAHKELNRQMRAALPSDVSLSDFDSLVFYYPSEIASQFGWCGVGGWAYTSIVTVDTSPGGRFTVNRASETWLQGIAMRQLFEAGSGTVLAHEFGHQLGFGHAAGTKDAQPSDEDAWKLGLANYGDNSAIMGNDARVQNSFTAVVRWRLGALPEASVHASLSSGRAFDLQALTLPPSASVKSAALFKCAECRSKILNSDGTPKHDWNGGYIWLSFRGSTESCNGVGCHVDHSRHYNKLFVHYQQPTGGINYMTTERWYYIAAGESYTPPGADKKIFLRTVNGDVATVAVHNCNGDCSSITDENNPAPGPAKPSPDTDSTTATTTATTARTTTPEPAPQCRHEFCERKVNGLIEKGKTEEYATERVCNRNDCASCAFCSSTTSTTATTTTATTATTTTTTTATTVRTTTPEPAPQCRPDLCERRVNGLIAKGKTEEYATERVCNINDCADCAFCSSTTSTTPTTTATTTTTTTTTRTATTTTRTTSRDSCLSGCQGRVDVLIRSGTRANKARKKVCKRETCAACDFC